MAEDDTTPSGGRTAGEFRDIADTLRTRVDLFGKTLAAVATLGTTAVGLSEVSDLFPADGNEWWVVGACVALGVAALAAIWVAVRLMLVGRPVFLQADLERNEELDGGERTAVRPVFEAHARRFGYSSLIGLQERERSLRLAASHATGEAERARRTKLADDVKEDIEQALARGQLVVVRRRATKAVSGAVAWALYGAVIVGLIVFAVGTDIVSSDRRDTVADAKACGDARKAGATAGELARTSPICDGEGETTGAGDSDPPTAAEARAQVAAKLAETLTTCAALVHVAGDADSGPLDDAQCDRVRRALAAIDRASNGR